MITHASHTRILLFNFILILTSTIANAQYCDSLVPLSIVDLSASPNQSWISPFIVRDGNCCGTTNPDNCLEFVITLHPSAIAVSFDITLKSPSTLWTSVVVELLITTIGNSHPTASSIYLVEIEHHSTGGMTIATPVYIGGTGSQTITTSNPSTNVAQIRIFGQGGSTSNVGAICRVVSGVTGISSIA